jgi:membrane protease YdiL (CAAX protease family)
MDAPGGARADALLPGLRVAGDGAGDGAGETVDGGVGSAGSDPGPAAASSAASVVAVPAGWYPCPSWPATVRYWDGSEWTHWVAQRPTPPAPPHPTLPLAAGVGALLVILVSLVGSRFLLDWLAAYRWPIALYVVIAGLVGYGPVMAFCWWASRRWGRGSLRRDSGLFARWSDVGWGPLTWLCCLGAQIVLAVLVTVTGIPFASNTEGVDQIGAERGYVITMLVLAVVAAPFVEEIVFRGIVLKSFLTRMHWVPAVALQGVLFGVAHVDPVRGAGNIGLALVLAGVGVVLGGAAYLFRRITPSIIAHAMINAIAMTIALSGLVG